MKAKKIWANFAVADTQRTHDFYTALGVKPNMAKPTPELASFSFGDNDFIIHFFSRQKLEPSMGCPAADLSKGSEIIFSLSATSEDEVRQWVTKVKEAGGTVVKDAQVQHDGYFYCVFADPDGHRFNVLLM